MAKLNDLFPSKWLAAGDISGHGDPVTIAKLTQDVMPQGGDVKPVIHFEESWLKPMILNKTNGKKITELLGSDDTDDWLGKKITLYNTQVEFKGEQVAGIRVKKYTADDEKSGGPDAEPDF